MKDTCPKLTAASSLRAKMRKTTTNPLTFITAECISFDLLNELKPLKYS